MSKRVDKCYNMWYNIDISKSLIRDRETDKKRFTICGWAIFMQENCALSASGSVFLFFREKAYETQSRHYGRKRNEKISDKDLA